MIKVKKAVLSHQKDTGTSVSITEVSLRDLILTDVLGDAVFGFLMEHFARDWLYEVRWGPKDPEYGISFQSLGSKLFDLAQWAGSGFGASRRERDIARLPVSPEWVREHFPDAGWPWDGTELEEESELTD